ncbi:hypothetical protein RHMOL_Rhmol04G0140500 [Rhododendron molle]|uniref:Uncharacterized protein n=1 Tax=Rhododendron molle TaxID=49168 RepID=A0ACC0P0J6_RHOML|nr:hypothetical protein RHMOL_Rhmol04G0140500 [Rhododendron molle]
MVESRLWTTADGHFRSHYAKYLKSFMDKSTQMEEIEEESFLRVHTQLFHF